MLFLDRSPWRPLPVAVLVGLLFLLPSAHPALIPAVGVASHLLWFVHVLPVAIVTWACGRRWALVAVLGSGLMVVGGERLFGAGFFTPADWRTATSLAVAVTFSNLLIVSFTLYARSVTDRYRQLFKRVKMGVMRVAPDGRIVDLNPEAAEILDAPPGELRGRSLPHVILSPRLDDMTAMAELGTWSGRMEVDTGAGPKPLHAFLATVAPSDRRGEYQVLLSDRSVEVLQAREIERQSKLAALGEALAGVAHELNNPLTAILSHAELGIAVSEPDGEPREMFEVVAAQARRMRDLLRELLGFSRKDQEAGTISVSELLRGVVRVQRMSLPAAVELDLLVEFEGELPVEATKLEQIVLNLVSNAAYSVRTAGGGTVSVRCRDAGPAVEIEIADDGPGIDPEILPTVFEPFMTTKPPGEGTGLGLAISRRLARGWGGDLEALNRPSGGASFLLTLPRNRDSGAARPSGEEREPAA